jgi:mitochondrial cardiolipin hydrolase
MEVAKTSVDAAVYGLKSERLARALKDVERRGTRLRLIVDGNKYRESLATQSLLADERLPFLLAFGRDRARSKMHHNFAILDRKMVLTGSYSWTSASEEQHHENLLILRNPGLVEAYHDEFKALWATSSRLRSGKS